MAEAERSFTMIFDQFGNLNQDYSLIEVGEEPKSYIEPIKAETEEVVEEEPSSRPVIFLSLALVLTVLVLLVQLIRIQLLKFPYYQNLASGNSIKILSILPSRGLILDQKGEILAKNVSQYGIVINLAQLPAPARERKRVFERIGDIVELSDQDVADIEKARLKGLSEFAIKGSFEHDEMLVLKEKIANTKELKIVNRPIRNYREGLGLGHLLGFMGLVSEEDIATGKYLQTEAVGRSGLEKVYQDELRGAVGRKYIEVDARGTIVRHLPSLGGSDPKSGANLKLHLDLKLQEEVTKFLEEAINERNKAFGVSPKLGAAAIVINPKNGAVLSLVSLPSYDNNLFAAGISSEDYDHLKNDQTLPMLNRAIQAQLPSGSVIKPVIAASALDAGTISPSFVVDTPQAIQIGNFTFPDWKDHGPTDIRRAIAESNNIFFYGLGGGWENKMRALGIEKMNDYFARFGYGQKTGIDLTGESLGFIPSPAWKKEKKGERWYIGDTYHFSIGQGDFLTTPLQMTMAIAAIANGGTLYEPRIASVIVDSKNRVLNQIEPKINKKDFISSQAAQIVKEGMRQAVEYGSAKRLNSLKVPIAGKTGTAQFGNEGKTHAWFASFAPFDNPELVVVVVVEGGGNGHESALPVAEKIYRYYYNDPVPNPEPPPTQTTPPDPNLPVPVEGE